MPDVLRLLFAALVLAKLTSMELEIRGHRAMTASGGNGRGGCNPVAPGPAAVGAGVSATVTAPRYRFGGPRAINHLDGRHYQHHRKDLDTPRSLDTRVSNLLRTRVTRWLWRRVRA